MVKKFVFGLTGVAVFLLLFSSPRGWTQTRTSSDAPVITHAFTVEKIRYGDILKVYIEAEDPNGDLAKIATVVDQPGFGRYPTSWVYVKSADRKRIKGYLQWNTFSSKTSSLNEWTEIALTVSVFDKAGNESNLFTFPISFETGGKRASAHKVPPPFDRSDVPRLGSIDIDLVDQDSSGPESAGE